MPRQVPSLTLADARALISAGEKKATELGIPYNLAVVDAGGRLIARVRMDDARLGSVNIAIIDSTNHDRVVFFGGGEPVEVADVVVGAVGASGGTVDQDVKVLKAALAGFAARR